VDVSQFNRISKALADPRRFEILEQIASAGNGLCCGEIVERFTVAQATVSHHLKELTDAGLLEMRPEGQFRYFRARCEVLSEYIEELQRRTGLAATAGARQASRRRAS
jgi:ArsR family transcriptional regulator